MNDVPSFAAFFEALTGHKPLRWQTRLFERMCAGAIPSGCDLPAGLGKTSVIPIWLIAIALHDPHSHGRLPRRLIYIVNRRTVVDQATDVAENMRRRLRNPEDHTWNIHKDVLSLLSCRLRERFAIGGDEEVFALSTLRGEMADNQEWKADPVRPAIVVGTIDMVGSKLLFSGYGDGRYHRAQHAGLTGQDVLVVHDEAHLTPAFSDLLISIMREQERACELRPIRVMELSATRRNGNTRGDTFRLEAEDEQDKLVRDRLDADKRLWLKSAGDNEKLIVTLVDCATAHEADKKNSSKVLIYVRAPKDAQKVSEQLRKALGKGSADRVALLTGTIRGHERDQLAKKNSVYRALLDHGAPVPRSVYLVSTSAGEVGIDLDADHMVCDLTTLDAMIQRLGRVNRCGRKTHCARVDVIADATPKNKPSEVDKAIAATLAVLQEWIAKTGDGLDVSPRNLGRLLGTLKPEEITAAFSPRPTALPLTDILLDAWSFTSIQDMPGRLEVAAILHGLTQDPPETFVVWRREITLLAEARADESTLRDWFRACRIESRERLRDRTDRVRKALEELLNNHRKQSEQADFPVVVLDERGHAKWSKLSEVTQNGRLDFRTIVLPTEAGGLDENGMLDSKAVEPPQGIPLDVAEEGPVDNSRERWLQCRSAEGERCERLLTNTLFDSFPSLLREKQRITLIEPDEGESHSETRDLVLLLSLQGSALEDDPETTSARQTLADHTDKVVVAMERIAKSVGLPEHIQDALIIAARWHDKGKDRPVWQQYARNADSEPLAKAPRYRDPRFLGGYRHEFGSLTEAMRDAEIQKHVERDLVLHLIAAHHGWARPHFEPSSFDQTCTTTENEEFAAEVIRRFGRLQQRFGRWGLAWLESLLRCADIAASKSAVNEVEPSPEVYA